MTPPIFDHALEDARRLRALRASGGGADFLFRAVADDVRDRLAAVKRRFATAVEIAPMPLLAAPDHADHVIRLDRLRQSGPDLVGDVELFPFAPASLDLVVSVLTLQTANDLPGALAQVRRALRPDGLFLAAFLGGDTLAELRQSFFVAESEATGGVSPRVAPMTELRAAGALLQRAGFALPVIDRDRHAVRYPSPLALLRDLRALGWTNPLVERSRRPLRRGILARAVAVYAERFADPDGRIRATFDVISLSGWAPHESQQRPQEPGSARARLADALKTVERSAGEKARR